MTTLLLWLMALAAIIKPTPARTYAGLLLFTVSIMHSILQVHLGDIAYYLSAAAADLLIIIILTGINPVPKVILWIQGVCFMSILLNGWGLILWFDSPIPSEAYNTAYSVLCCAALFIVLTGDEGNGRRNHNRRLRDFFRYRDHVVIGPALQFVEATCRNKR